MEPAARRARAAARNARAPRGTARNSVVRLLLMQRVRGAQKCSRFQPLAAFDGPKRTCARQLALQNARRAARSSGGTDDDDAVGGGAASMDDEEGGLPRARAARPRRSSVKAAVAAAEGGGGAVAPAVGARQLRAAAFSPQLLTALGQSAMPQQDGAMQLQACVSTPLLRAQRHRND